MNSIQFTLNVRPATSICNVKITPNAHLEQHASDDVGHLRNKAKMIKVLKAYTNNSSLSIVVPSSVSDEYITEVSPLFAVAIP